VCDLETLRIGAPYIYDISNLRVKVFLIMKPKEMHYFLNLFWYRTLHVSDRFTVHHQESSTVCCLLADSQHNLYDKYLLLYVQC